MKISFFTKAKNLNLGSYRIWIYELSKKLNNINYDSKIISNVNKISNDDVLIFGKDIKNPEINSIKKKLKKNCVFGAINPPFDSNYQVDFVIAGSIEETLTLNNYQNIYLYPLIEKDNNRTSKKKISKTINLIFHGNHTHLNSLINYGFINVLKKYQIFLKEINKNYKFNILTDQMPNHISKLFRKNNLEYNFIKYNHKNVSKIFIKQDIGIVTSSSFIFRNKRKINFLDNFNNLKIYNDNLELKFKNKTNFGRLFLLMQYGIASISDITPSNLSLYDYQRKNFLLFLNENQLLQNLIKLSDKKNNIIISKNAKSYAEKFNKKKFYEKKFVKFLKNIKKQKLN